MLYWPVILVWEDSTQGAERVPYLFECADHLDPPTLEVHDRPHHACRASKQVEARVRAPADHRDPADLQVRVDLPLHLTNQIQNSSVYHVGREEHISHRWLWCLCTAQYTTYLEPPQSGCYLLTGLKSGPSYHHAVQHYRDMILTPTHKSGSVKLGKLPSMAR